MISAVLITQETTKLISKIYREDVLSTSIDYAIKFSLSNPKLPILTIGSTTFVLQKAGELNVIVIMRNNSNISPILCFMEEFEGYLEEFNYDVMNNVFKINNYLDLKVNQGYSCQ